MIGQAYVFLRRDGAPLPPGCAGHVGWGFRASESDTFYYGATENLSGKPFVPSHGDNGWWALLGTQADMLAAMRQRNYDGYKFATVRDCNAATARAAADALKTVGYIAIGSNCLDHVWRVLDAYGVKGLPWLQTHPSPNDWFALYNGEFHNL